MSDELKIELQVETDDKVARSQLDELIKEYKNKKPIELGLNIGKTNLETFQSNIKSITEDLQTLSGLNFNNLKTIEKSLKNISEFVGKYQSAMSTNLKGKSGSASDGSLLDTLPDFENEKLERLSKDHKTARDQIDRLVGEAEFIEDLFGDYRKSIKGAYKKLRADNTDFFSTVNELENKFDTSHFEKLVAYKKELNHVLKEYASIGVNLVEQKKVTNEMHDGTFAQRRYQQYVDEMGVSEKKFEQLVNRAKDLNQRKNQLYTNIKNNLKDATEEEKAAFKELGEMYKKMPTPDFGEADAMKSVIESVMSNGIFKLELDDLDMRFDEDFHEAYERFFKKLDEVKDEYNNKFKGVDGFEGFEIFNIENLSKQNDKLDKEIEETTSITKKLTNLGINAIDTLGLDERAVNIFEILGNSAAELEGKLENLKSKFGSAFEISSESSKSLEKIKDALIEINKLTEEQKQIFFDFGLDVDNIEKAKKQTEGLKSTVEDTSDITFDGLIESYSKLSKVSGDTLKELKEVKKLRTSDLSTVTLNYRFDEDEETGNVEKKLDTVTFADEVAKRSKQIVKEYTNASKDLIKAQSEYFNAVTGGKSSEDTINKLSDNVKQMEGNLSSIRNNINELKDYPDVMDNVMEGLNEIDDIRHRQMETDALKVIDKADLAEANGLLKESKKLIDNISKDSVQLQKDTNAGYKQTSAELDARIKSQEKQLTNNISKLMKISNSKAAIDQIFSYQLEKAQKTQIDIARINDKANKTTGTKIVDEQDEYLKKYKATLNQIKSIQKSLVKETNEEARSSKLFDLDNALKELDRIESKLNDVKSKVGTEFVEKAMSDLNLTLANAFSKTSNELDKIEEKITKLGRSNYVDENKLNSTTSSIRNLRNILEQGLDNLGTKELSGVLVQIEKLKQAAKDIDLGIKISKDSERIETFVKGVTNRLEVLQSTADGIDISHITKQFSELTAGGDRNSVVMKSITDDVRNLEKSLKSTGNTASSVGLGIRGFIEELDETLRTFTLGEIIGDIITDAMHQTWDVIQEMDAAMSNLKKVADESDVNSIEKLDGLRSQAIDVAKEVGMASSDVINAIADTLQAGIGSMEESIQVARSSMILANVGDMSQELASQSLNTIINGYKIDPLKEIGVEVGGLTQKTTELANAMDLLNYAG